MIFKHYILLVLILSIQYDGANGTSRSSSLPPFNDVVGSTPVADVVPPPPPPYCVYPPPPNPTLPAPLPPTPAIPGAAPPTSTPPIAPVIPPTAAPPATTTTNAPPPATPEKAGVWCVANPTVASAVAQTAMDYACGSGADCDMVAEPGAPCFLPDTLMAHASYAFNSYWQRTKVAGGTCDFAGAAMLITKDPSYAGCKYVYM
uniref:X8 domain-containing protein n=1 Tax=Leersia perrieri TaxID=77586 RepID=A0A0D9WT03_9ORYZ